MNAEGHDRMQIIWVHPGDLFSELSAATYVDTTRQLREHGCEVTLVTQGPAGPKSIDGVDVLCLSTPDVYFFRQLIFHLKVVLFVLSRWRATDIVLFHELSAPWILPLRVLRLVRRHRRHHRRPLLVGDTRSVHMPPEDHEPLRIRMRGVYLKWMVWAMNRWADGRTAITRHMVDEVHIPAGKLWGIWPSGVNPGPFREAMARRRWPGAGDAIRLIYIGSLEPERGLATFCRAVEHANALGMHFMLTLIGSGDQKAELEALAAGTQGRICVLPPVAHDHIPLILADAHVGVLPFPDERKFQVSSPIKLFEYMASGMPILATRIVCNTDVVGDGQYVFWADRADDEAWLAALGHIAEAYFALAEHGKQAAAAVEGWTWEKSAASLKAGLEYGLAHHG